MIDDENRREPLEAPSYPHGRPRPDKNDPNHKGRRLVEDRRRVPPPPDGPQTPGPRVPRC